MSIVITQSLPIPAGLANGQIADAGQITPLFNSLNAFNIPDELIPFKTYLQDLTTNTLTIGGTVIQDYTVAIPAAKVFFYLMSYSVSGNTGLDMAVTLRKNGVAITAAHPLIAGAGPFVASLFAIVPAVASANGGLIAVTSAGVGGLPTWFTQNTGYATVDTTDLGISITGTAGVLVINTMRVWAQP